MTAYQDSFEDFLRGKHMEQYVGDPDYAMDEFDEWLSEKSALEIVELADRWQKETRVDNAIDRLKKSIDDAEEMVND